MTNLSTRQVINRIRESFKEDPDFPMTYTEYLERALAHRMISDEFRANLALENLQENT